MPNYQNCKIYKIINDAIPDKVYYGHTVSRLSDRLSQHKKWSNKCTSKELFTEIGAKIILVESYPCNNVDEAKARERHYIENNECVNKNIPGRTQKEWYNIWYEENKEVITEKHKIYREQNKEQRKIYYEENKEKIAEYLKIYYEENKEYHKKYYENKKEKLAEKMTCICGSVFRKDTRICHERTNKHKAFLELTASNN